MSDQEAELVFNNGQSANEGEIVFSWGSNCEHELRFKANGEIERGGKPIACDKELVEALRDLTLLNKSRWNGIMTQTEWENVKKQYDACKKEGDSFQNTVALLDPTHFSVKASKILSKWDELTGFLIKNFAILRGEK